MGRVRLNGEGEGYRVLGIGYGAGSSYWGTRNRRPPHTPDPAHELSELGSMT